MNFKLGPPIALLIAVSAVAAAAWWYLFLPEPVTTGPTAAANLVAPTLPAEPLKALSGEELKARLARMAGPEIRRHGIQAFERGDPDAAFLLYKKAAGKGDGWSARAIGEMYDPATFDAGTFEPGKTAFSKPNPRKALSWYDQALAGGDRQARPLRDRLVVRLEQAAADGDAAAQRVLRKLK